MVYKNHVVAAVKVDGKVLRETNGEVLIPFGSEYSIFLKNLNSVRVQVKVSIDGKDVIEGIWLIIPAHGSLELERFIRNGNLNQGNKLKFIERSKEIEDHRGIEAEDGLIRVEYKTEKVTRYKDETIIRRHYVDTWDWYWPYHPPLIPYRPWRPYPWEVTCGDVTYTLTSVFNDAASSANISCNDVSNMQQSSGMLCSTGMRLGTGLNSVNIASIQNDVGITVEGAKSDQKFVQGSWFATEEHSDVLVLKLRGEIAGKKVKKAATVNRKPKCKTCGLANKGTAQFCSRCGTALEII